MWSIEMHMLLSLYHKFTFIIIWNRYYELKVGGGATPRRGDLVVIDLRGEVEGSGQVFVDTFGGNKKPLALVMGSRPYGKGMCEGIEYVLRSMKAGGKRRVIIPPNLAFGANGADLGDGVQIPPFATLEYIVEVEKVSIAPAWYSISNETLLEEIVFNAWFPFPIFES